MTEREMNSVADLLISSARRLPAHTALVDGARRFTYGELLSYAEGIGTHLVSNYGIERGAKVALLLPNSAEFAASFFAVALAGGVSVPINPAFKEEEVKFYIHHSGARLALASKQLKPVAEKSADVPVMEVNRESIRNRDRGVNFPVIKPEDEAIYLYSTGSTGKPKRVARTHFNLLALAVNHTGALRWTERERVMFAVPMSHTYGFGNFISAAKAGATIYTLGEFNRASVVNLIEKEAITAFPAVPFMLDVMARSFGMEGRDFSSLRIVLSAGAPLSDATFREFHEKFGIYPRQLYGSTETGAMAINLAPNIESMGNSVGRPLKNVEVRVLRDDGSRADVNEIGEITVKSPSMTPFGYFGLPEETALAFRGGYYYTGDLGRIDGDGYIFIVGRRKLFINISGNKVDPAEVESFILRHPKVKDAAVLGVTDADGVEAAKAVIVAAEKIEAREIYEFLKGRLADYKIPRIVEFREEIPKSPTGKVLRERLK